eukprot:2639004-Prymnesium_polylepis.2
MADPRTEIDCKAGGTLARRSIRWAQSPEDRFGSRTSSFYASSRAVTAPRTRADRLPNDQV